MYKAFRKNRYLKKRLRQQSLIEHLLWHMPQQVIAQSEGNNWQSLIAKSQGSIVPTASAQFKNTKVQSAIAKLSWTHFVRLLSVKDKDERNFYLIETAENNWSVRELDRQINSSLFERLLLSKDKKGVKVLAEKGQIIENAEDALKDPYVLEFLGLEESIKYPLNNSGKTDFQSLY